MKKISFFFAISCLLCIIWVTRSDAQMSSPNFKVPSDSINIGGLQQNSDSFSETGTMGEIATGDTRSNSYISEAGFLAKIGNEPALTFAITDDAAAFGTLSKNMVRYDTAMFRAATTSKNGYVIEVFGNSLSTISHTITPLNSAGGSNPGDEQFGFNLRQNSNPTIGNDPAGGKGQAVSGYSTPDAYKFTPGDIVAQSVQQSQYTDYTASFIGNIDDVSHAGEYSTKLTFVITGKY
jgi:hypothetical protein